MLAIVLLVIVCLVLPVALRFAEGDDPDNGVVHHQEDEPRDEEDPDVIAIAA
jgi:hypothetical protein